MKKELIRIILGSSQNCEKDGSILKFQEWWPKTLQGKTACAIAASRMLSCQERNLTATKTLPALTSVLGPEVKIVSITTPENPMSIK